MAADFYRKVLESAPWGAIVASTQLDGRCFYVNPEFVRLTGYDLDDIPTVAAWIERAYPDPEYRRSVLANWPQDTDPSQMHRNVVYRVTCRDGASKHIQLRASLTTPSEMIVMLLDVTDWRQAAVALEESEERYRQLVESCPLGIVLHVGKTIDFANRAAARIIGLADAESLVGRQVLEFVHPSSAERAALKMADLRAHRIETVPDEQRFVRADGTVIDVELTGAVVQYRGQEAIQVVIADISQRKRMERAQQALGERLLRAQKTESLALLAGGVAHDLNNLLSGVLGHADLARRPPDGRSRTEEHLDAIVEAAERAAELAGQLLAYAGRRRTAFEPVSLNELVRRTGRLLRATAGERAELVLELTDDLPSLEGDATQLRQILLNLVANAADALEGRRGRIRIATGWQAAHDSKVQAAYAPDRPEDVRHVWLEVSDDGAGMAAETAERIFEPFFTTKAAGRGLGLAAALGIARAHAGAVAVSSRRGEGTSFRFYFPASNRPAAAAGRSLSPAGSWHGAGLVLVVDDEPVVRQVARAMLERAGLAAEAASSGDEALAILSRDPGRFACVLLDLTMPGLAGEQTLEGIRALRPELPVVLSSGFDEADTLRRFADHSPAAFLQKPYTYDSLIQVLRQAIAR